MLMADTNFTLRLDEDLKNAFTRAAKARDLSSAQVLREFMRRFAAAKPAEIPMDETPAYNEWFASKVRTAQADPRPSVPSARVERHFAQLRATAKRKSGTRKR